MTSDGAASPTVTLACQDVVSNYSYSVSQAVNLLANTTFAPDSSGTLAFSAPVTGSFGVSKSGSGLLVLAAANTYTGSTTVSGGTLQLSGSIGTGTVNVLTGGKLVGTGTINGALSVQSGGVANLSGTINGSVNILAGGMLTHTGTINGTVTLAGGSSSATQGVLNLVDSAIGTTMLNGSGGLISGGSAAATPGVINVAADGTSADKIALGAHPLNVSTGGLVLDVTNQGIVANKIYTLLSYGSLTGAGAAIGSGVRVGAISLAHPFIAPGLNGALNVTGTSIALQTISVTSPSSAYWQGSVGTTWASSALSGGNFTTTLNGSSFIQSLPGTTTNVFFSNSNAINLTNTLGMSLSVNSLTFSSSNASAETINDDGNTLTIGAGGLSVQAGAGAITIATPIAGTAGVNNAGTLTLLNANSYTGGNTITAGKITLGSDSALGVATNSLSMTSGTLDVAGHNPTIGNLSGGPTSIITNTAAVPATLTIKPTANISFPGKLTDAGSASALSIIYTGTNTVTIPVASNYHGSTTFAGGTFNLTGGTNTLPTTTTVHLLLISMARAKP